MSGQENTPPEGRPGSRAFANRSTAPFTEAAVNSLTASSVGPSRSKPAVTKDQLLPSAPSQEQPAQPVLPEAGLCVFLKDEFTPSEYEVRAL